MPQISIIVPVYNTENFVGECIESLLAQTLHDIEIILVDDGSTDNSCEVCQRYVSRDPRVKLIRKENGGAGSARNAGIDAAKGMYVGFVDSDDFVAPQMYARLFDAATAADADCARCGCVRYLNGKTLTSGSSPQFTITGNDCSDYAVALMGRNCFGAKFNNVNRAVYTGIYRTSIIRDRGIRFLSERDIMSEDTVFNFDFFSASNTICVIADCLYYYRLNEGSISRRLYAKETKKIMAFAKCMMDRSLSLNIVNIHDIITRHGSMLIGLYMAYMSKAVRYCSASKAAEIIRSVANSKPSRTAFLSHPRKNMTTNQRIIRYFIRHKLMLPIYLSFYLKHITTGSPGDGQ